MQLLLNGNRQVAHGDAGDIVDIANLVEEPGLLHHGFAVLLPRGVAAAKLLRGAIGKGDGEVAMSHAFFGICFKAGWSRCFVRGINRIGDGGASGETASSSTTALLPLMVNVWPAGRSTERSS